MTKEDLIRKLTLISVIDRKRKDNDFEYDAELELLGLDDYNLDEVHIMMDDMLLEYIGDEEISELFNSIFKYYI